MVTFSFDNTTDRCSATSPWSMSSTNPRTQQHSLLLSSKLFRLTSRAAFISSNFSVAFIFFITEKRQTNTCITGPLCTAHIWFAYIFPTETRKGEFHSLVFWCQKTKITNISKKIFKIMIEYSKTGIIIY